MNKNNGIVNNKFDTLLSSQETNTQGSYFESNRQGLVIFTSYRRSFVVTDSSTSI